MSQPFHIKEQSQGGQRVLVLSGELDLATAPQLDQLLIDDIDTVLDLSDLSFIDSTGVRLLVRSAQRAQQAGRRFEVRRPHGAVHKLIKLVGIEALLGLEEEAAPTETADDPANPEEPNGHGSSRV